MFNETMRQLRRLQAGQRMPVSVQTDDDGYFDRLCPSAECQFLFKVHWEIHSRVQAYLTEQGRKGLCNPRPPQGRGEGCTGVPALKLGMKLWGIFLQKQGQGA